MARKSKSKRRSKSPKSPKGKRKSPKSRGRHTSKSRFGSSPPSKLKMEHLPTELLQLIYDKIPSGKDRVALASTSKQMNNVPYAYESLEHFISNTSDVETAIQHRAIRVTFKNKDLIVSLLCMPFVKYLNVDLLGLKTLPTLPPALKVLICSRNDLTELPTLPSTLVTLDCSSNLLTKLPPLPPSLKVLNCSWRNNIRTLPTLPSTLEILDCSDNNGLTRLPTLPPNLKELNIGDTELTRLPVLPQSLKKLTGLSTLDLTVEPVIPPGTTLHDMDY